MGPNPDDRAGATEPVETERIPWQQKLYESPFILLLLGVGVVGLFYTLWGLVEILTMPTAPLP